MEDVEAAAIYNLASINNQEDWPAFQPYKSFLLPSQNKQQKIQLRPQTVCHRKHKEIISLDKRLNGRDKLKAELRNLEQKNSICDNDQNSICDNDQNSACLNDQKRVKRVITTKSVLCMISTLNKSHQAITQNMIQWNSRYIEGASDQKIIINKLDSNKCKENAQTPKINSRERVRLDIKKRLEIREQFRQQEKIKKINSFLKLASDAKNLNNTAGLIQRLQESKRKKTLTSLLC